MATSSRPLILVPARGGSREIPRKSLRLLGHRPLVCHTVERCAAEFGRDAIIVSTDDPEIAHVVSAFARVLMRPMELASHEATLDEVAADVARVLLSEGVSPDTPLITVQPTSPFITPGSIRRSLLMLEDGARSVISVRDDRRLRWARDAEGRVSPLFENRVNRQWLPATFAETGGIIGAHVGEIAATGTRIHPPVGIVELHGAEGLDIDSPDDWMVAESFLGRRRIVIRADAGPSLGMGHAYRAIALANELLGHTVTIVTRDGPGTELGPSFFSRKGFPARCIRDDAEFLELLDSLGADITFLDVLDTSREFVSAVRERTGFVVSLEDLGEGGLEADLLVNDLYSSQAHADNRWYGVAVSLLSPQFETVAPREDVSDSVERVVISFGGTDPNDLTRLALEALKLARFAGRVTVVLGPGRWQDELDLSGTGLTAEVVRDVAHMALLMRDADIAITSGGRTVTELMTLGIPTIVLCQNQRELWHTHASPQLGVLNLGLGAHAAPDTIAGHFRKLTEDRALRAEMRRRALEAIKGRSNRAIVSRILAAAARTG